MKTYLLFALIIVFNISLFSQTRIYPSTRAQIETPIAINPTNTNNLIGAAITLVSSNFAKIGYYYSLNGGQTWQGNEDFSMDISAGDPVIAFDLDGVAYIVFQVASERKLYMRKSSDGGITWMPSITAPATNIISVPEPDLLDKPWMAISPIRNANGYFNIYISFTYIYYEISEDLPTEIKLYRSTDGGNTFSQVKSFSDEFYDYLGSYVEVGPTGEVFVSYAKTLFTRSEVVSIKASRSTNQGGTFSNSVEIPVIQIGNWNGDAYYLKERNVRADCYPRVVVDRSPLFSGTAYLIWSARAVEGGDANIRMIKGSLSGGQFSWNTNVISIDGSTGEQWMPAMNVNPDGVLSTLYYSSGSLETDPIFTKLRYSTNGGSNFSEMNVGSVNGFNISGITFLGDYHGIASWFGKTYNLWCEYKTDPVYDERQVYFRSLDIPVISPPSNYVKTTIDQKDQANQSFEKFSRWNQEQFTYYTPPHQFIFQTSSNEIIRAKQNFKTGTTQKHHNWNLDNEVMNHRAFPIQPGLVSIISQFQTSQQNISIGNYFLEYTNFNPETDKIWFRDPWYIDYNDPPYGFRSQGMTEADYHEQNSPINFSDPEFSDYLGVFLNQPYTGTNPVYYKVKVAQTQDVQLTNTGNPSGRYHKFYFQNWTYDANKISLQTPSSNETAVVFKTSDALLSANLKGTQLSQNSGAYNSNSQRKYVKSDDGYLHCVYESMGKVWYELSSNNGATWVIQNNGNPISTSGKSPAIDYHYYYDPVSGGTYYQTVMVWQEQYGSNSKIKVAYFHREFDTPGMEWIDTDDVATVTGTYSTTNCTPVVSYYGSDLKVVFRNGNSGALMCRQGLVNIVSGTYMYGSGPTTLTSTNSNSVNPSIAVNKSGTTTVRLVWEQIQDVNNSSIKYAVIVAAQISGSIATISTGSGYPLNFSPSISVANNYPVVSWIVWNNSGGGETYRRVATSRGATWGTFQISGTEVNFVNNNSVSSASEKTVIVWSEGTIPVSKWMKRTSTTYSTPASLSNSGIQSQVCGGTDYQYMSAMVFKNTSMPYYFLKSTTDFSVNNGENGSGFNKITETDTIVTFGRSGVADINGVEFAFNIGDILVGDSIIKFIEVPDTLVYSSFNELNEQTITENFTLSPETNFFFTNIYYTVQKSDPDSALTETDAVNFKAEIVNSITNQVVGTFDNITYNKNNLEKYASIDYQVDCSGITAGDYYLRLVTTVTGEAGYSLANIVNDNTTLAKKNYQAINFTGSEIPITYALEQNYPNPFNPITTIRYQLPKEGLVALKVYDILGAEVATLVNEEKVAGKYEVNFNASKLASGVYIYRLNVNDFVNVKKMVLVK